ncbi:MAG: potassium/proton antiporter [Phycisphaerales bacterium]|nr:potassium/proton antiporter [Phycisphaerales bacterium]
MTEFTTTALLLGAFGALLLASVLLSRGLDRAGVPVALLFLILGMLAGSEGLLRIPFDNFQFAFRVGTLALILILFDGGLNTSLGAVRKAAWPASVLATAGVALTAGLVALAARMVGLPWAPALLLGAVVSSTDAATVFAVLRGSGLRLKKRLGATLELESGVNDPMAVILTVALTESILGGGGLHWSLAYLVPLQLLIGGVVGAIIGHVAREFLIRVKLSTGGLYPVITLAVAFIAFGGATVVQGSGFLAVYAAALVIGNGAIPYRSALRRIHDAIAWLCQIGMFLMLGMLVFPSQLLPVALPGLALGLFLAFVARPAAVALCLLPFRFPPRETLYLGWVGLRGAVPIILATFPVLSQVPDAHRIFNLVFFMVVVNAVVPGSTVRWVTRQLRLDIPESPTPSAVLEVASTRLLKGELMSFYIDPSLAVCDAALSQVVFPEGAGAALVVRGDELLAARGSTVLRQGDHVYIFCRPEDRPFIELLFGRPQGDSAERSA